MRLLWPDILKILAIFGVILLHVSAPFLVPFENSRQWWIGNIYDSLSRWCVPLFVMVSGALILPGAETVPLRQFLFVRVRRILIPFLFWSMVYFFYRIHVKGESLALSEFFRLLLTEPIYYHLWFVYMLIILYLFAPAISAFLNEAPCKHVWYLICLWFFWSSILPIIDNPLEIDTYFTSDMDDYSALRLSGYFLLGYMLRDWYARPGYQLVMLFFTFLVGGAATILGTYAMSMNRGEFHSFFYNYYSITVVAMTVSLFLAVKSIFPGHGKGGTRERMNQFPRFLHEIGMSVFGVYLIHALVLELLRDGHLGFTIDHANIFGLALPQAAGLPVFALSIFVFSLFPVYLIRFIPKIRDLIT